MNYSAPQRRRVLLANSRKGYLKGREGGLCDRAWTPPPGESVFGFGLNVGQ